jgi:hypothetical protein
MICRGTLCHYRQKFGAIWSSLYRSEFGLLQFSHRAWTDVLRRGACGWFWRSLAYCPFTVHLTPENGYIPWTGLKQAKRLTVRQDSKHAGLALTV